MALLQQALLHPPAHTLATATLLTPSKDENPFEQRKRVTLVDRERRNVTKEDRSASIVKITG